MTSCPGFSLALTGALAAGLGVASAGCATYVAPAASTESFFSSPFRILVPEVQAKTTARIPVDRSGATAATGARRARGGRLVPASITPAPGMAPPPGMAPADAPLPPSVLGDGAGAPAAPVASVPPAVLVESALQKRGVRFGTDGSVGSLYTYIKNEQALIPARSARAGDVVFFNIEGEECADHVGVIESVDAGRIAFREARDGQVRTSYVDPGAPSSRRGPDGRILNSFLRPRRTDDPPAARYFAGEMLCAVGRVRR